MRRPFTITYRSSRLPHQIHCSRVFANSQQVHGCACVKTATSESTAIGMYGITQHRWSDSLKKTLPSCYCKSYALRCDCEKSAMCRLESSYPAVLIRARMLPSSPKETDAPSRR